MTIVTLEKSPEILPLFGKAVVVSLLPGGGGEHLPDTELRLENVPVDRAHLARYDEVCGIRFSDLLPVTYPHVLAFPLSIQIMADRAFPFPLAGLVHIHNVFQQIRPVTADEPLTLSARVADLRAHPKGRQFEAIHEARVADELVVSSRSTYLARGGGDAEALAERLPIVDADPASEWLVPSDLGRRYGAVSGDRNPIHMAMVSARLFGFPKAIAHGMWTAARAIGALEGKLPASFRYEVQFQQPILLPSKVGLATEVDTSIRLSVKGRDGRAHMTGVVTAL